MEYRDYYKLLGVERTATQDEIKRAYRKLARKYHPDINHETGAEDKFKEIGEAHDVLGDPEKRAAYDQLGMDWKAGQEFQAPPNWDAGFEFTGPAPGSGSERSDFFETLFAGLHRNQRTQQGQPEFHARGEDHHARIMIDLRDSYTGATRAITLRIPQIEDSGHLVLRDRTLNVTIPKGIVDGQHIRLKGQGSPGIGRMPAGDLYLEVHLKPDALYRVAGKDVFVDLPVAPWEVALGASVKVPTPAGAIMLKIPPDSFQGRELRVKGRGLPASNPGDFYAVLTIVLPPADTDETKNHYEDMARTFTFDPRATFGDHVR
jgi:curved DNA-binding protein